MLVDDQTRAGEASRRERTTKRRCGCWIVTAALCAIPTAAGTLAQNSGPPRAVARVRVWTFTTGPIDPAVRDQSTQMADALLETAGVIVDWHPCDQPDTCSRADGAAPSVTVILLSAARPECGLTSFAPDRSSATILVSMPCVADRTLAFQLPQPLRSHPLLATLEVPHLVGAILAHEIGHVLGLKHADTGLMRARLEVDDVIALREGRLAFSPIEGTRMRASNLCANE